ncbi:hypothetical protein [Flavivirga rizhaonensis]|uniref:TonB-dependent receptor plug domain-containing protein n=1 Tax=Flavivirga rizhaonensis TaxID=2559571 RepID=A0A4S1E0Q6_9FLAO|nr:hypothetical protein [Flavivirga rizhaonensis]TGV03488.1 hypothetical protein EM932_05500 [Flavivirga rizhaonensis]
MTPFKKVEKRFIPLIIVGFLISFHLKTYSQEKQNNIEELANKELNITKSEVKKQPLYLINNREISKDLITMLDSMAIKSIEILKPEKAIKKYGRKGKNGVVEVSIKQQGKFSEKRPAVQVKQTTLRSFLIDTKNKHNTTNLSSA